MTPSFRANDSEARFGAAGAAGAPLAAADETFKAATGAAIAAEAFAEP